LEKIIQKIPETIEKAKAKVEEELKKREKLRSLEPLYLKTESLKNNELVKLKEDINKYQKEILELDNKLIQVNILKRIINEYEYLNIYIYIYIYIFFFFFFFFFGIKLIY